MSKTYLDPKTKALHELAPGQKEFPQLCEHPNVALGPRPDRETCADCLSSWPEGTLTGRRAFDAAADARVKEELAKLRGLEERALEAEVQRRVEAELKKAVAKKAADKSAPG